jgi:hypothetical protein
MLLVQIKNYSLRNAKSLLMVLTNLEAVLTSWCNVT